MYEWQKASPAQRASMLARRKARHYPWHSPPHTIREEGYYLLTAACIDHQPFLHCPELLDLATSRVLGKLVGAGVTFQSWVFLPNHYHILAHVPDFDAMSMAIRLAHSGITSALNWRDAVTGRRVWYRYTDARIRTEQQFWRAVGYIHINPVKHGYVTDVEDWPWSTVHEFIAEHGRDWVEHLAERYPPGDFGRGWDWT